MQEALGAALRASGKVQDQCVMHMLHFTQQMAGKAGWVLVIEWFELQGSLKIIQFQTPFTCPLLKKNMLGPATQNF